MKDATLVKFRSGKSTQFNKVYLLRNLLQLMSFLEEDIVLEKEYILVLPVHIRRKRQILKGDNTKYL